MVIFGSISTLIDGWTAILRYNCENAKSISLSMLYRLVLADKRPARLLMAAQYALPVAPRFVPTSNVAGS